MINLSEFRKSFRLNASGCDIVGVAAIHVKFWKCQCGRFIRKSEGLGENGILYVN